MSMGEHQTWVLPLVGYLVIYTNTSKITTQSPMKKTSVNRYGINCTGYSHVVEKMMGLPG